MKNLSKSLVLRELAKAEEIELANEEIQTEVTGMLTQIQQTTNPKALSKQLINKNYLNALTMDAASRAMSRKVFERLKDIATGKTVEVAGKPVKAARSKSTKEATDSVQSTDEQKPKAKKTKAAAVKEATPATVKKTKKVEKTSE